MSLIHPSVAARLRDEKVQNLVLISLALGTVSSVAAYWAFNEVKGEPRTPLGTALTKAVGFGVAYLAYKAWSVGTTMDKGRA
jgi:ABC-type Mn2+/Zn2+ transport system permease subunit